MSNYITIRQYIICQTIYAIIMGIGIGYINGKIMIDIIKHFKED